MELQPAKVALGNLLATINPCHKSSFLKWIKSSSLSGTFEEGLVKTPEAIFLENIASDVRSKIPENGIFASESIKPPENGPNADCQAVNTVHVDAFLKPEEEDEDEEEGDEKLYCSQCGSRQLAPLTIISHSASRTELQFIFQFLLPSLEGATVLDIGSRLGAVLYAGYCYSKAPQLIGVELNTELCAMQLNVIYKHKLQDRIHIVEGDICEHPNTVAVADVITMNNVFEFFLDTEAQKRVWEFLYTHVRPGTRVVSQPSIEEQLHTLQPSFPWQDWVTPVNIAAQLDAGNTVLFGSADSEESDLNSLYLYTVNNRQ